MNYIVGLFLCYMPEEDAFWTLRQVMENAPYSMASFFEVGFPSYYMIINAVLNPLPLRLLVLYFCPKVHSCHLQEDPGLYSRASVPYYERMACWNPLYCS